MQCRVVVRVGDDDSGETAKMVDLSDGISVQHRGEVSDNVP